MSELLRAALQLVEARTAAIDGEPSPFPQNAAGYYVAPIQMTEQALRELLQIARLEHTTPDRLLIRAVDFFLYDRLQLEKLYREGKMND